jgi:predicted SAM-dependent methyltransferase
LRINLGSGTLPIAGFTNVDILPDAPGVDVVADISQPLPFADRSADMIYAAHVLEHFPTDDVPRLLADWRRVLRDGGELLIAVPDLDVIARTLIDRSGWFTPPHNPWIGVLYGGQKDQFDFHKTGFTAAWLASLLQDAGFGATRRVDRFEEISVDDASFSPLPFGRNVSLNMRTVAGGEPLPRGDVDRGVPERVLNRVDAALSMALLLSTGLRARVMGRRQRRILRRLTQG